MESGQYDVVLAGVADPDADRGAIAQRLGVSLKIAPEQVARLLDTGREITIKRSVEPRLGQRIQRSLESMGLVARLRPVEPVELALVPLEDEPRPAADLSEPAPAQAAVSEGVFCCPKCRVEQPRGEICTACGLVFAKYEAMLAEREAAESARQDAESPPRERLLGRVSSVLGGRFGRR